MTKRDITQKPFCVINEGRLAIGETETGVDGADEAVQALSLKYPERVYVRDEPTRHRRFFGNDQLASRTSVSR